MNIRQIIKEANCTWEIWPRPNSKVYNIVVRSPCDYWVVEVIESDDDERVDKFLTKGHEILKEKGKI